MREKRGETGPRINEANGGSPNRARPGESAIQLEQRVESKGLDREPRAKFSTSSAASPEWKLDRVLITACLECWKRLVPRGIKAHKVGASQADNIDMTRPATLQWNDCPSASDSCIRINHATFPPHRQLGHAVSQVEVPTRRFNTHTFVAPTLNKGFFTVSFLLFVPPP